MQTRPVTLHTQCIRRRCIQRDVSNATYPQPVPERKTAKDNEIRSESASEQPTQKKQKQKDTESECNAQAQAAAASLGEGACHLFHMSQVPVGNPELAQDFELKMQQQQQQQQQQHLLQAQHAYQLHYITSRLPRNCIR